MQHCLIVGLGNPGTQYEHTRHNAGFLALDAVAQRYGFPEFKLNKKSQALLAEGEIVQTHVVLAKPQTFMNNSGKAVKSLLENTEATLILLHDDIDIPIGEARIAKARGSAGHKGVESVIQHLGTKEFTRIRIGVLPETGKPENVEEFVLQKFSPEEKVGVAETIQDVVQKLADLLVKP